MSSPVLRYAEWEDADPLLEMMRELYLHDGVPFDEARARKATDELISSMDSAILDLGRIWMIESEDEIAGYLVLTFGFSIEYGGMHGFIDELYVRSEFRGRGLGSLAVDHAAELCQSLQMHALLLEVDLENPRAHRLSERLRFKEHGRRLMTRPL